jgi:hypothetical protein
LKEGREVTPATRALVLLLGAAAILVAALSGCSNRESRLAWFQACSDAGFTLRHCGFLWAERRQSNRDSGVIYQWRDSRN